MNRSRSSFARSGLCALVIFPGTLFAQSITIDGQTATTLRSGAGGRIEIGVAPPTNGLSVNSFERFNVPSQGAAFDNSGAGASAILADVTGTEASRFEGTLDVLGTRADVIVANPNGFVLNGARFQNMRGLGLVAGRRRAGTLTYDVGASDGAIQIGPQGVIADVRRLDLIAREMRIEGSVGESDPSPFLRFNATTGTGAAQFDTNAVSVDADQYLTLSERGRVAQDGVTLTLAEGAIVSGGRLTLTADGRGAGVQMAGQGLASAGEFVMTANGKISLQGAKVAGLTGVNISSGGIAAVQTEISSGLENIELVTRAGLTLENVDIQGVDVALQSDGLMSIRAGSVDAFQQLNLTARGLDLTSLAEDSIAILRGQEASFQIDEDFTNNTGLVQAAGDLEVSVGGTLRNLLNAGEDGEPIAGFNLGTLQADGVVTVSAGHLQNSGGLIRGGSGVYLLGGQIDNTLLRFGDVRIRRSCFLFLCRSSTSGAYRFFGGGLESDGGMNIDLSGSFKNIGGTVSAAASLSMSAASIDFRPLRYASVYTLPRGPGNLFFGSRVRQFQTFESGQFIVPSLGFSITAGDGRPRFVGTEFASDDLINLLADAEIVATPDDVLQANGLRFGILSGVLD